MNTLKYIFSISLLFCIAAGCKKELFNDTSFATNAKEAANLSVLFDITQDNTGLVTITPNGEGAVTYDIYYGDATATPVNIAAGKKSSHVYKEGVYTVKVVGYNIAGKTTEATQQLTVSFKAPQDLKVTVTKNALTVGVAATALYETLFKVYYGDSSTSNPVPFTAFLEGQAVTHTYASAGTYILKVVALSGGAATTTFLDTIKVAKQLDLPVSFEDANVDYALSDFGGNASSLVTDPANNANKVMKAVKTAGAEVWAGTTLGGTLGFATKIPVTSSDTKMSIKIYSPAAGLDIKLKIEDHNDPTHSVETDIKTTVANQWETLTFDFKNQAAGTSALNTTYTFDKASVFFDFGASGSGKIFYCDDLKMLPPALAQINLPVTFDDVKTDYTVTDFGGNSSALAVDPTSTGNKVMKSIKTSGAQIWAGTTVGTGTGFATKIPLSSSATKMSIKVYSPAAGIDIKLKVEDHADGTHSVETDTKTTLANQWETLTFDFSSPAAGTAAWNAAYTYDKASVFFDFGNAGDGRAYYFDDIKIAAAVINPSQINLPVTFDDAVVDYTVTDFGSNVTVPATDPTNAANKVKMTTKPAGAQTWAGTTIGTATGFATAIPVTASHSKMTVKVYSPAAGLDIKLKIEDHNDGTHSVETDVKTTLANQWETLTFDFSTPAAGTAAWNATYTYDKASVFFDFGNAGSGLIFYWDDVKFL
jgi:hypothetical protein